VRLQGLLIVKPADGKAQLGLQGTWDEERVLFLQDWFHGQAEALAMSLNRLGRLAGAVRVMKRRACPVPSCRGRHGPDPVGGLAWPRALELRLALDAFGGAQQPGPAALLLCWRGAALPGG
jgi:hypothetical protein